MLHLLTSTLCASAVLLMSQPQLSDANQLSNDPPAYFGGADHQGYIDWVTGKSIDSRYGSSLYLPSAQPSQGAAVHWKLDGDFLNLAVAARATGWIGFGIGEAGGMLGSDMALFEAAKPTQIIDAHVVDSFFTTPDDCQHDWETVDSSTSDDGFLLLEMRRKLDTGDPQDKKIVPDSDPAVPPHRIIAAWGNSEQVSYHGSKVTRGSVRFHGLISNTEVDFDEKMSENADGSFSIRANNYTIPTDETTYAYFCFTKSDLLAQGVPNVTGDDTLSIIGVKPVVTPREQGVMSPVHHFIVYASYDASDNSCDVGDEWDGDFEGFDNMVYVWAPGDGSFALPDFLGIPFQGSSGFNSYYIEIHYDNPQGKAGVLDSSGVDMYFTSQPREQEMGVLQLGDPFVALEESPIGEGMNLHQFTCPSTCSSSFITEPVTVLREYQHMHMEGARFVNEQIRDGTVVRQASVEVWEFDQNGNTPVQQDPYQILPGDGFRTSCYYNDKKGGTKFGLASSQEMCIAFLYYYPKAAIRGDWGEFPWMCGYGLQALDNACFMAHETKNVTSLERQFGAQMSTCNAKNVENNGSASAKAIAGSLFSVVSASVAALWMLF